MDINFNFKNRDEKPGTLGSIKPGECFTLNPASDPVDVFIRLNESQNLDSQIAFVSLRSGEKFLEMPNFTVIRKTTCVEVE